MLDGTGRIPCSLPRISILAELLGALHERPCIRRLRPGAQLAHAKRLAKSLTEKLGGLCCELLPERQRVAERFAHHGAVELFSAVPIDEHERDANPGGVTLVFDEAFNERSHIERGEDAI